MAVTVAEGEVVFTADMSRLSSSVNSGIDNAASSASGHGSRAGKLLGGAMAVGLGVALAGAGGIAAIIKTGFDEASDASAGNAQLAAGIKSTGNAAGVTVGQLNKMAGALQNSTGQTDDSITAAQSLLLTFTNISNAGPEKVFDRTTVAAADMAARMGGDASSNAILLGKALNDPAKGVSRLTKVGVTFTDQQKAQIAQMQKVGDVAGAQGVILDELGKEFGGSAKAAGESFPGTLSRLKRSFEDFSQGAFEALVPVLTPAINLVIGTLQKITPAISQIVPKLQSLFGGLNLGPLMSAIGPVVGQFAQLWATASPLGIVFQSLAGSGALGALVPLFTSLGTILGTTIAQVLPIVQQAAAALVPILGQIFTVAGQLVGAFAPLITQIVGQLAPIFVQLVSAIVPPVIAILGQLVPAILPIVTTVASLLIPIIQALLPVVTTVFQAIVPIITAALQIVTGVVKIATGILSGNWSQVWSGMKQVVSGAWGVIKGVVVGAINIVKSVVVAGVSLLASAWSAGWARVNAAVSSAVGLVTGGVGRLVSVVKTKVAEAVAFFTGIPGKVTGALSGLGATLYSSGSSIINQFISGIKDKIGSVGSAVSSVVSKVTDFLPHSPAKLGPMSGRGWTQLMKSGQAIVGQFTRGLITSRPQVVSASKKMLSEIQKAWDAGKITGTQNAKLNGIVHRSTDDLIAVVDKRTRIIGKLKAAQTNLTNIMKDASSFKSSVTSGLTAIDPTQQQNGADFIQSLRTQVAETKTFTATLARLKKAGLDDATYRSIATKGLSALPIAQSLLKGGKPMIKSVSTLQGQLSKSAGKLGTTATRDLYGAGISAAKGIVQGLESQETALNKAMRKLAKSMVKSIKSELGIHSPSKLLHDEVGVMMGRGISGGLAAEIPNIRRGVVQGVNAATRGVTAQIGGSGRTGSVATVDNRPMPAITINEAQDPMGTAGRVGAEYRKWARG